MNSEREGLNPLSKKLHVDMIINKSLLPVFYLVKFVIEKFEHALYLVFLHSYPIEASISAWQCLPAYKVIYIYYEDNNSFYRFISQLKIKKTIETVVRATSTQQTTSWSSSCELWWTSLQFALVVSYGLGTIER